MKCHKCGKSPKPSTILPVEYGAWVCPCGARNRINALPQANAAYVCMSPDEIEAELQEDRPQRGGVLLEAREIINGERQDQYGAPEDSFALIARYWEAYLGMDPGELTAKDAVNMMVLFKMAREANQHKRDNYRDMAGYVGIAADMAKRP